MSKVEIVPGQPTVVVGYLLVEAVQDYQTWNPQKNEYTRRAQVIEGSDIPFEQVDSEQHVVKVELVFPADYFDNPYPTARVVLPQNGAISTTAASSPTQVPDDKHSAFDESDPIRPEWYPTRGSD